MLVANFKTACDVLGIQRLNWIDSRFMSDSEKADLLAEVKREYRRLLKIEHPDMNPDRRGKKGGLGTAHDRTIQLRDAFQFINEKLSRRNGVTITEWFEKRARKRREAKSTKLNKPPWHHKPVRQYSLVDGSFIKEWPSIAAAAQSIGVERRRFGESAYGHSRERNLGGYIWKIV